MDSRQPHVDKQREEKGNREESRSARTVTMRGRCGRALHLCDITIISRDPNQGLICNNCKWLLSWTATSGLAVAGGTVYTLCSF